MVYSLTVAGYQFENPPEEYRKLVRLSNQPQTYINKEASDFYQSDSQDMQFQVEGSLALDPALGGTDDLDELERLQQIAIEGGEVDVQFDPFFSGKCVIEDDPFRQAEGESTYSFTFAVNSESTDPSAYPARTPPDTGNTFEFGSLDLGYDPGEVNQNYERNTSQVKRLQGVARSVDTDGLVPKVRIGGNIDGAGQADLWQKARDNVQAYLSAEFQSGWALIDTVSVRNNPEAPDYLTGLFQYDLELLIVNDAETGIGDVSTSVDNDVKQSGTYVSDSDSGKTTFDGPEATVNGGSGSIDGSYVQWLETTVTLSQDATNYLYVTDQEGDGQGTVQVDQSGFPSGSLPLYRTTVSAAGTFTKVVDMRSTLLKDQETEEGGHTLSGYLPYYISITVFSGGYEFVAGLTSTWYDTAVVLGSDTRNYVWAEDDDEDGAAQVNTSTSGYPTSGNYIELYRVDTDQDSVTDVIDDRPAGITSTTTGDADITLSDSLSISDELNYERLLTLADALALGDAATFTSVLRNSDTLALSESNLLPGLGITSFSDKANLDDGGTVTQGGSGITLTTDVTLNGESVEATVFEDTDGDGSAEYQQTVSIPDGTGSVNLDQMYGGQDSDYWIRFDLSTTDTSVSPSLHSATVGFPTSGVYTDQNPNTAWELTPATYDRSGNEYEGGGVVAKYEG